MKKSWDRYHNFGGKEEAAEYYKKSTDLSRSEANIKYKNMPKKEKNKKESIKEIRYYDPKYNDHLKEYQKNYDRMKKIKT